VIELAALVCFTALLAFLFAKVEIMVEGPHGWATGLPCWRVEKHWLLDVFFGGKAMTGYHAWVLPFMLLLFHLPVVATWSWTWGLEYRLLGSFMLFWILEDILWFILNPAWGLRRLRRADVFWHKHWWLGLPADYWIFGALALLLFWWSLP
jgi:hypothetical protein